MFLRNIRIAARAFIAFAAIALLSVFLGLFALKQIREVQFQAADIQNNWMQRVRILALANASLDRFRLGEMAHILSSTNADMQTYEEKSAGRLKIVKEQLTQYAGLLSTTDERSRLAVFNQSLDVYAKNHIEMLRLSRAGDKKAAVEFLNSIRDSYEQMTKNFDQLIDLANKGAEQAGQQSVDAYEHAIGGIAIVILLVSAGTVIVAWLLTRSITAPIIEAMHVAETIARGDLTQPINPTGNDEATRLLRAQEVMRDNLVQTLRQITGSSNQLAAAAEELNAVTAEGSRDLRQQHGEIEQAATAVTQMTTAIEDVARNAASTSELSQESRNIALKGQQRMVEALNSIRSLTQGVELSSEQVGGLADQAKSIGKVLDVIRAIAEQTNLLALNAAIEAARAGDAGRGFAVVADEVRALAHRTAQSTQEIEQMIGGIQTGTANAVNTMHASSSMTQQTLELAELAQKALADIVAANDEINDRNLVITTSADEQAHVARAVDQNLLNIQQLSIQSSEGSSQTTAASQSLATLASELNTMVKHFQV
ncbi:methyl-accepting chemotaxis protein [Pseudomonas sp. ADAK13]|jgi:methyl-accepting chemotaxis protein|uniref:methyl-accepting chemotaxis protein n=2 Tax=unclassified Pseudomonas TaxID=196821 RepID=UPI00028881CA|nr:MULTISPECIES: methyl-accepting chemotaxis protein [unclassified Pseudomonas]QJI37858.1 methyl-accepting chemotaxis protein [Pseudomonas sp. ADAK13]